MKKVWIWVLLPLLLWGCGTEETFETIADEQVLTVMAEPRQVKVQLPEGTAAAVMEGEGERLYLCGDHEILLETRPSGDLDATLRLVSGYSSEAVTVLQTQWMDVTRYDLVWACAGETGDRLGRAAILDDGTYHYCLSVLWDADGGRAGQAEWDGMFDSFALG